ncbi:hypothetical protein TARUN_9943, partial [Trichoderma arundinaceum]
MPPHRYFAHQVNQGTGGIAGASSNLQLTWGIPVSRQAFAAQLHGKRAYYVLGGCARLHGARYRAHSSASQPDLARPCDSPRASRADQEPAQSNHGTLKPFSFTIPTSTVFAGRPITSSSILSSAQPSWTLDTAQCIAAQRSQGDSPSGSARTSQPSPSPPSPSPEASHEAQAAQRGASTAAKDSDAAAVRTGARRQTHRGAAQARLEPDRHKQPVAGAILPPR